MIIGRMTDYSNQLRKLLQLRANVDKAIQAEADRQGIDVQPDELEAYSALVGERQKGVGYVVFSSPSLQHAAAQIAAAAERWGSGRG